MPNHFRSLIEGLFIAAVVDVVVRDSSVRYTHNELFGDSWVLFNTYWDSSVDYLGWDSKFC